MSMLHDDAAGAAPMTPRQDDGTAAASPAPDGLARPGDAAPGARALGELTSTAASALVVRVLGRQREQWRRTADDVRSALAGLERACETAGVWHPGDVAADVSELVNGVVAAAAAEASAAADRAHADARATIDDLRASLARLESESLELRDKLTLAAARQRDEHESRLKAEAAWAESQRVHERVVSVYLAQLQAARLDIETERLRSATLRQQLTSSLENALRAVQGDAGVVAPAEASPDTTRPAETAVHAAHDEGTAVEPLDVPASPNRGLKLVPTAPTPAQVAAPAMVEYVSRLLDEAEVKYDADVAAALPPLEVVDRLTASLRLARARLLDWSEGDAAAASSLFRDGLMALLNARLERPFGRHLSISFHELYPVAGDTTEAARKVS